MTQDSPQATQSITAGIPMNFNRAAEYLGLTERHLQRLVAQRRISHRKCGRLVRFTRADLDDYLADVRVAPTAS
jgi:excisionase family DNA binding protein